MQYSLLSRRSFGLVMAGALTSVAIAACEQPQQTTQAPIQSPAAPEVAPSATISPAPAATAPTDNNVAEVVADNPSLSTLASVIDEADLEDTLEGAGPYTVFAPSNEAFNALPAATRERLLQPENRETLRRLLTYHVVSGQYTATQLQSGPVPTAAGQDLNVQVDQGSNEVRVNNARVIQPDLQASNGVVHVVDQVILPPGANL